MKTSDFAPEIPPADLLPLVLETLPVGVWIMDEEGRITYGNPAGRRIWGGARYVGPDGFDEYRGWWVETGEPIQPEEWAAARAIRDGETSIGEIVEIECFDGSRKVIRNSALPLHDDEGEITGAVIINQDVTHRVRMEKEREALIEQLQDALADVHTLTGLLPICANCKKIRDDSDLWHEIDAYVTRHSTARFSHGLCPSCVDTLYPEDEGDVAPEGGDAERADRRQSEEGGA